MNNKKSTYLSPLTETVLLDTVPCICQSLDSGLEGTGDVVWPLDGMDNTFPILFQE